MRVGIVRMGEIKNWNLWKKERLITPEPRHFFGKDLQCSFYLLQVINPSVSRKHTHTTHTTHIHTPHIYMTHNTHNHTTHTLHTHTTHTHIHDTPHTYHTCTHTTHIPHTHTHTTPHMNRNGESLAPHCSWLRTQ